ncbi:hypothetical protein FNV43_RR22260 [Rhamnella rubrinervis]|uniref:R13L1/DRL21-like LRR repeat region domain-containing protein n=1 Tax=Rhamnella rubrinervis TaxID=2594499 RepID=A0A8K0DTZ5_9ROSA|nr:hypothetical protein FNV43_RR22260 [Rhamnella rubrinervis]
MTPPQVSNLKNLEGLKDFYVGKNGEGASIRELGKLQCLHGYLCIKGLENVENVGDVSEVNFKDITSLRLVWNGESDDSHKPREILNQLRPHTNLKSLFIENYGSTNFPDWVGHHSFSCITFVELVRCNNCYCLPTLGQLPSLEYLYITGFDMLERIGEEFYYDGSSSATAFKSLIQMNFSDMPLWKEWLVCGSDVKEGGVFSKVEDLTLSDCEMINGACLPDNLPSLSTLEICGRNQLLGSLSTCHYPSLYVLKISGCGELESFPQGALPSTITHIEITSCQNLVSLSEEGWPSNLDSIRIENCGKLFADTNINKWSLRSVTSLKSLSIGGVPDEVGDPFPEEGQFPITLTSFKIINIPSLKSLNGDFFKQLTSLESLTIDKCMQLQCLPEEGLPASLSMLRIRYCTSLKARCQREIGEDWHKMSHIPRLLIFD